MSASAHPPGQDGPVTVLVVGAGPTGLTAAALLGQRGIACVVIERRTAPYALPRAVHLDDEAMRILQEVGVAQRLTTRPARGLRLLDAQHRTLAQFDRGSGPYGWPAANFFDQPELERLLRDRLTGLPSVTLLEGTELVGLDGTVRDTSTGHLTTIEHDHLLGCDGAGSTVRALAGIGWRHLGFEERWLVVDGTQPTPLGTWDGVHQVCDPARAATYLQVSDERYRWEFRLHDGETADSVDLDALLHPWQVSPDLEVVRRAEYTFRAGIASAWRTGKVVLLGDAAHQTPPFIGQGLGLGLRDASNLAWKIAMQQPLESYESERAPHARALIRKAIVVGWALTGGQGPAAVVRRRALAVLCRAPRLMAAVLDRPTPPLSHGLLAGRDRLAGRLVPQPPGFDDQLGQGFALVTRGAGSREHHALARRWDAREVTAPPAVAAWMGRAPALLVRPDRVVLASRRFNAMQPVRPRNDPQQYDDLAHEWWKPRGGFAMLAWISAARVRHLPPGGGLLLDVACGGGLLAPFVTGWTHVGVDLSQPALTQARDHGVHAARADVRHLPFADSTFDVVVAGEILEHVTDLAAVVAEVCRVLRPGGTLVIDTIARTWWGRFSSITVGERIPAGPPKRLHDHHLFVDRAELLALASSHGVRLSLNGLRPSIVDYLLWLAGRRDSVRMLTTRSTAGLFQGAGVKA